MHCKQISGITFLHLRRLGLSLRCFRRNKRWVFRLHLQSQERYNSRYQWCKCSAAVCQCYPVGALVQARWLFYILLSLLYPCRVHLAEETGGDESFFTGPLGWKYHISFTGGSTTFTPSVDGFGTSDVGRFVSQFVFNFPVMPFPDVITADAQSWELQEWHRMCEYENVHGLLS